MHSAASPRAQEGCKAVAEESLTLICPLLSRPQQRKWLVLWIRKIKERVVKSTNICFFFGVMKPDEQAMEYLIGYSAAPV
jgi:hypothetical protein